VVNATRGRKQTMARSEEGFILDAAESMGTVTEG
jgi:hypothetical protein